MKHLRPLLLASALVLVSAASVAAGPPIGQLCVCPQNYAPVICSNGQVYGNACEAGCAHATGCVPYSDSV